MANHKLKYGLQIITKLNDLGLILGYYCQKEHRVDEDVESAVDVAWLFEKGQKYPLFIFEIESATTNTIFANPSKIFGESNQKFEKPLFLFHLLLKGGKRSAKISQLENLFGKYNYRIYRLSLNEETNLVLDVLSQHRRIVKSLDFVKLLTELFATWNRLNLDKIIFHIESLEFDKGLGTIIPAYALLTQKFQLMKPHFIRLLKQKFEQSSNRFDNEAYQTYLGGQWDTPIHLGLLAAFANDNQENKYFEIFRSWQEESYHLKQIGPSYGLSMDYDMFILGMSGAVLGLTSCLFFKSETAMEYISDQLFEIVSKSNGFHIDVSICNSLWLLLIASNSEKGKKHYQFARGLINKSGGIPERLLQQPPTNYIGFYTDDDSMENYGQRIKIPKWSDFQNRNVLTQIDKEVLFDLAVKYLVDNDEDKWNPFLTQQL